MKRCIVWLGLLLQSACAVYHPLALDRRARAPDAVADITIDARALAFAPHDHVFDPSHGLDMTDVAMLAVTNDPQLQLARDVRGIGVAQAFAAGLLPDPVFNGSRAFPISGPAAVSAYGLGLAYDISALLTHPLAKRAAAASTREVNLNLLWMEWQVVSASRELFIRDWYDQRMLALSRQRVHQLAQQQATLMQEYRRGDASLAAVDADLARLQAARTRRDGIERRALGARQGLDALLGLSPHAKLRLRAPALVRAPSDAEIDRDLAALPRRRPDLLALQAGYRSEDARYRQAIWQQFPAITVGLTRARGTDNVTSQGFGVALTLPIFNRNRGHIAIERATRRELHDAYTVRLVAARSGVERILQEERLLEHSRKDLARGVRIAARTLHALHTGVAPGDVSLADELPAASTLCSLRLELLGVERRMQEQQVALRTLLGDRGT